ncbi:Unknown protein sequence [Pseudomonas syringae pv. maculicola str. M6]|nr:Unknown protein sequence [Pseudomonas syringae pv. maculicola str. M6]
MCSLCALSGACGATRLCQLQLKASHPPARRSRPKEMLTYK